MFCPNVTRRDTVEKFTQAECIWTGAWGLVHASHFLSEISFKLGLSSKYGS